MAFQPVPGCVKVTMEYLSGTQTIVNTYHYEFLGSITLVDMETLANIYETWENTHNKDKRWSGSQWKRVIVTDLSTVSSPGFELSPLTPVAGTQAAEPIANSVAVVTTLRTAKRGRSYRGRIYWGMLTELTVTGDGVNGTEAAEYDSNLQSLFGEALTANFKAVVVSRTNGGVLRPVGEPNAITGTSTSTIVASQRRRLPR